MTTPPSGPWPPQPPPDQPQGPGHWGPPPPWGQPPQNSSNRSKWILGVLALLVVVVVTLTTTLLLTRGGSATDPIASPPPPSASVGAADIASADDDGPIEIITQDPSCPAWTPIGDTFAAQASKGWNERDSSIPASDWTPAQRAQHEQIAEAMRTTADETVALARLTPHRVMRELYEQTIAYLRAYAEKVPRYTPADDHLARVAAGTSNALTWICSAITYGSAASRAPLVIPSAAPLEVALPNDPSDPARYVTEPLAVCPDWLTTVDQFNADTAEWQNMDTSIPSANWTREQQAIFVEIAPLMSSNADTLQNLGIRSENSTFDDFAALAAQYRRAFVQSIASYTPADAYLAKAAGQLVAVNYAACEAAEGS